MHLGVSLVSQPMPTWRPLQYCNILQYWLNSLIHCQKLRFSNSLRRNLRSDSVPIAQPFVPDMSGYDQGHEVVPYGAGAVDHYEHQHPRRVHQELALSFSTMRSFGKRTCSFYEALQARRLPLLLNRRLEKTQTESSCQSGSELLTYLPVSLLDPFGGARWHNHNL